MNEGAAGFHAWRQLPQLLPQSIYSNSREHCSAQESKLRDLVRHYSEFINFPIYLLAEKEVDVPVEEEGEEQEADPKADATAQGETEEGEEGMQRAMPCGALLLSCTTCWPPPAGLTYANQGKCRCRRQVTGFDFLYGSLGPWPGDIRSLLTPPSTMAHCNLMTAEDDGVEDDEEEKSEN